MKRIKLTRGYFTTVDDADYVELSRMNWCSQPSPSGIYALTKIRDENGLFRTVKMHQVILGVKHGMEIDHIDGDTLNNQRGNLRHATVSQNQANRKKNTNNLSGYKGVSFCKTRKKYRACIQVEKSWKHLGYFNSAYEAHKMYSQVAQKYFGQFARI